jgi:N-acyl-D-amino-acid deacylase
MVHGGAAAHKSPRRHRAGVLLFAGGLAGWRAAPRDCLMPNARRSRYSLLLAIALLAACAVPTTSGRAPSPSRAPFDIILRGGTVLDGTGRPGYRADVGVRGVHIARIGDLSRDSAGTVIDVSGLVVAPGFINIHSHAVPAALPTAANMLRQGVTTEIVNSDGGGPIDVAGLLARADSMQLAVNVGAYAPFNSAWASVVGNIDRRPSAEQLGEVTALLDRALAAGAWGVSAGLDYKPGYYATTDEVVAVLSPLREWRTNFTNHDRLTPEGGFSSIVAMHETIEIGERSGLLPVITHMKLQGRDQGRVDEALAMMRAATARGVYTAADVYPYLAGQSGLAALFVPGWALEGGRDSLLRRLSDSTLRARIIRETDQGVTARVGGGANIRVFGQRPRTIAETMAETGARSAGDAIARILEVESPGMIATFGIEPDLVKLIQYPDAAIACDCGASNNASHPRYFGSFPRVLGHYVRESRALPLAEAVRKMTGLPATIIGMTDRGFVAVGMAADLTVFDPATVIDRATFERPMEPAQGIRVVLVNGRVALRDGEPTGETGGRALRRMRGMRSRPMNVDVSPGLTLEASDATGRLQLDLAKRMLSVTGGGERLEAIELGLLQTAERWSSITGIARDSSRGEQLPFVLVVDDSTGELTLDVHGRPTRILGRIR